MLHDLTVLDWTAIAWAFIAWLGYDYAFHRNIGRFRAMNHELDDIRRLWMYRMLERDNRIMDVNLVANTVRSVSLFASTSMLIMAGLAGALSARDDVFRAVAELGAGGAATKSLFELKIMSLMGIFIYSFFKFTWSVRQFNYLCALIGSAPLVGIPAPQMEALATTMGKVLSESVKSFNAGMRSYYFALATLAWFIGPWPFIIAIAGAILILGRRQTVSKTAAAVRDQGALLQ